MMRLEIHRLPAEKETALKIVFCSLAAFLMLFKFGAGNVEAVQPAGFNLIGTVVSKTFTGAVIKDSTGMQSFFRLYEALPDGSKIVRVQTDSISLREADGSIYDLFISHEIIPGSSGPPRSIDSPPNVNIASPASSLNSTAHLGAGHARRVRQLRHRFSIENDDE